jgi:hypothetical protein
MSAASAPLSFRPRPERLTREIAHFIEHVWT